MTIENEKVTKHVRLGWIKEDKKEMYPVILISRMYFLSHPFINAKIVYKCLENIRHKVYFIKTIFGAFYVCNLYNIFYI